MIGAVRNAFDDVNAEAPCDLCGDSALVREMRDCRAIDALLAKVCPSCIDELCDEEDSMFGDCSWCSGANCSKCV